MVRLFSALSIVVDTACTYVLARRMDSTNLDCWTLPSRAHDVLCSQCVSCLMSDCTMADGGAEGGLSSRRAFPANGVNTLY